MRPCALADLLPVLRWVRAESLICIPLSQSHRAIRIKERFRSLNYRALRSKWFRSTADLASDVRLWSLRNSQSSNELRTRQDNLHLQRSLRDALALVFLHSMIWLMKVGHFCRYKGSKHGNPSQQSRTSISTRKKRPLDMLKICILRKTTWHSKWLVML